MQNNRKINESWTFEQGFKMLCESNNLYQPPLAAAFHIHMIFIDLSVLVFAISMIRSLTIILLILSVSLLL